MNISDIKKVELEITSNCNAACPGCARTQRSDILEIHSFTVEDLISIFPKKEHIEGKTFKFCGVLGDPVINPDCFAMVKYLVDNGGWCQISTNAGLQTVEWWRKLGKLSAETKLVDVSFCIDGHRETNHIYRVNTKFDTIERNMQAYSNGGNGNASASWIYIIFDHNEHELEIAKEHALRLGFTFAIRTGMRNSYHDWVSIIKKRNQKTKKLEDNIQVITTTGAKEHAAKEEVFKIDEVIKKFNKIVLNQPEITKQPLTKIKIQENKDTASEVLPTPVLETTQQKLAAEELRKITSTITCKYVHEGELFIASNLTLWPCCFLWDSWFANKDNIRLKFAKYDSDWNSLSKYSIAEILAHPWYEEILALSWDPTHSQHINRCVLTCSLKKAYQNKIEVIAQAVKSTVDLSEPTNLSCNHLSNHLAIVSTEGMISPCCQFKDWRNSSHYKTIWNTKSLNGVLKSEFWRGIRTSLDNNQKISGCDKCWKAEQVGSESRRKWINSITEETFPIKFEDIELGLDYTCNMMCRICKPSQSSKWNNSSVARDLYSRRPAIYIKSTNGKEYQDRIKEILENSYLGHIKRVRLVGGEPFYSKNFEWFIQKLDQETVLEDLTFAVNSNGSLIPKDNILQKILRMKSISIDLSIDAIGNLASTTRWGVPWQTIAKNIDTWIDLSKNYKNINLSVHSTISVLNVNRLQELIDFCDSKDLAFGFSILTDPDYLDFRQFPVSERSKWMVKSDKQEKFCINDLNKAISSAIKVSNNLLDFVYFNERMNLYQEKSFNIANPEIITLVEKYKYE